MKVVSLLAVLTAAFWARAAPEPRRTDQRNAFIPNRFIIEVDAASHIPSQKTFARNLDSIYTGLRARDVEFEVTREFQQPEVFVGASLTIKNPEDMAAVQSLPGVKGIYPVRRHDRLGPVLQRGVKGTGVNARVAHSLTGVDKLHELGIKGKGVKVAIVDSGIDYNHPNLGGGFGPDFKVIGGYDLVGDDGNNPIPDEDPLDNCDGIGSHLAGVVAASGENEFNVTGVAPEASLLAYRIYGCFGGTDDEVIIDALSRAVADEADIITMSFTGWNFSSADPIAIAASQIVDSGKVFVAAAGDLGNYGAWFSLAPASSPGTIAVGSVDDNGLVSDFSTYGPTYELFSQPAVAAPGRDVVSTIPRDLGLGDFAPLTGTDVSAAYVVGAAALLLQHKGRSAVSGKAARDLLETNARTIPTSLEEGSTLQTVIQAGGGLLNVFNAAFATTVVSPGDLLLNDTAHFKGSHSFSITNSGNATRDYKLSHTAAGTALTIQENSIVAEPGPVPLSNDVAQVTISPEELSLAPGETAEVAVTITPPSGIDASRLPVYSGFIVIDSAGETQHVTYLGLASNIKEKQILDPAPEAEPGLTLPLAYMGFGDPVTEPFNFTFADDFSFPLIRYRMAFSSPRLRWDLVDSSVQESDLESGPFTSVAVVGTIVDFGHETRDPLFVLARGYSLRSTPTFFNGTRIPDGSFRFLLRALRNLGNPERLEDWESWLSPIVGFDIAI